MKIIGITGTNCSGKDTASDYLRDERGFKNYSLSDEIRYELTKRGLEHSRENLFTTGNEIREKFSPSELALRAVKRIKTNNETENVIISSIRNPAEIEEIKKNISEFILINIDAPIEMRYIRACARGRVGDGQSLDEFKKNEERELDGSKNQQQLASCAKLADFNIWNDGNLNSLYSKIEKIIS